MTNRWSFRLPETPTVWSSTESHMRVGFVLLYRLGVGPLGFMLGNRVLQDALSDAI